MKVLSRDFSTKEKVLILILILILVGLAYYQFVDQAVRTSIQNSESEAQMLQTELDSAQARLKRLRSVENSLTSLEESGNLTWMGSYNNEKGELSFLNDVLADTLQYSISFATVTRNGNQIRRSFTLQYMTSGFEDARKITGRLLEGENRCLVGDMSCTVAPDGKVTLSQSATFYETMVGGVADAALPVDSAAANR